MNNQRANKQFIVIGAGPGGIASAINLAKRGYSSVIYDSLHEIVDVNEDSYPIGLNPRGMNTLKDIDEELLEAIATEPPVESWNIYAGARKVANLKSGTTVGSTRSAVTYHLYRYAADKFSNLIEFKFSHKLIELNTNNKQLTFQNTKTNGNIVVDGSQSRIIGADGVWSKVRRELERQHPTEFQSKKSPWNTSFRLLFSSEHPKTELNTHDHYIFSGVYVAVIRYDVNQWVFALQISSGHKNEKLLLSNDNTESNRQLLKEYVQELIPAAVPMIPEVEYERFFSRRSFTGAVVQVNKMNYKEWVILLGDAAHAVNPATGEGVNAALEDALVIDKCAADNVDTLFSTFNERRIKDVTALTDYANFLLDGWSAPTYEKAARTAAVVALQLGNKYGLVRETWADKSFGTSAKDYQPYSEMKATWDKQTHFLLPALRALTFVVCPLWRVRYAIAAVGLLGVLGTAALSFY